jgi:hypothetical protein
MAVGWPASGFCGQLIADVQVSAPVLDLKKGHPVVISWRMESPALISAYICDLDGEIIKKLHKKPKDTSGAGSVEWDGRDDDGHRCSDGAYIPIIQAKAKQRHQIFNPTMQPWGQRLKTDTLEYNLEQQQITYHLSRPALCLIRVGETDGGPLYATLAQWTPKPAGTHLEAWNGRDAQGLVNVAARPKLKVMIDAIALPETSILVIGSSQKHHFERSRRERMPLHPPRGSEVFMHSLHERRLCRDIDIAATIENQAGSKKKPPVLRATASVLVDILDRDHLAHLRREGAEVYAFMDGEFVTEVKVTDFPARVDIDTAKLKVGEHVLTVNVKATEDHLGTYSLAVSVER